MALAAGIRPAEGSLGRTACLGSGSSRLAVAGSPAAVVGSLPAEGSRPAAGTGMSCSSPSRRRRQGCKRVAERQHCLGGCRRLAVGQHWPSTS